jgi:hypothetical protein
MVYWTHEFFRHEDQGGAIGRRARLAMVVVLHAGVLSATRIVGVPLVGYPLVLAVLSRRRLGVPLLMTALGAWGFLGYLWVCQVWFGAWNQYWRANRDGWGMVFDLSPWGHASFYRGLLQGNLTELLGRVLTILTLAWFTGLIREFWRALRTERPGAGPSPKVFAEGLALAVLGSGLLVLTVIAKSNMACMIRYLLPVHLLLFLAIQSAGRWDAILARRTAVIVGVYFGVFQTVLIIRYCSGGWVS